MTLVAGQQPDGRGKARARRRTGAVVASVLVHGVVFAIIGLTVPKLVTPDLPAQPVDIWLMPQLTPLEHKPAQHKATSTALPTLARPRLPKPAPAQVHPPAAPANAPPAVVAPGPVKGLPPISSGEIDGGQGAKEALRTSVGCDADNVVHLTPYERDHCNQKFGEIARKATPFSGIDVGKRLRFDAQAEADERRRTDHLGIMPPGIAPCTGEGANLGGACLPDSAIAHMHQH